MVELSREFVETFKTELVSGITNNKRSKGLEGVEYNVVTEKDDKGTVVIITLSVGGLKVFEKKLWTTYGSEVEIESAQVRAVRSMINELPYIYKTVVLHIEKIKDKTPEQKVLEAMMLLKEVFNKI